MRCTECDEICNKTPLELKEGEQHLFFCSFECLIVHSAGAIRRRLQFQNRRLRVLSGCVRPSHVGVLGRGNRRSRA